MVSKETLPFKAHEEVKNKKFTPLYTMKKFNQLFLTILAIISTALFVFYKHEYDRLYNVLEVLNTFGDSKSKPCAVQANINFKDNHKYQPESIWQKIGPIYMFSAFLSYSDYKIIKIEILTLITENTPTTDKCLVWLDNEEPLLGKLSLSLKEKQSSIQAAIYECIVPKSNSIPYAVSPFSTSGLNNNNITIDIVHIPTFNSKLDKNQIHACVIPSKGSYINPVNLAEFIVFHQAIGVSSFSFYETSMALSVRKFFATINLHNDHLITVLPWKIPDELKQYKEQISTVLVNDCKIRNKHKAEFIVFLESNEFVMPRHHNTIQDVIKDVTEVTHSSVVYLHFTSRLFCMEYANDPHSSVSRIPLITLQKTRWKPLSSRDNANVGLVNLKLINDSLINLQHINRTNHYQYIIPEEVLTVNWYKHCERNILEQTSLMNHHDDVAYKFQEMLTDSEIIQFAFSLTGTN